MRKSNFRKIFIFIISNSINLHELNLYKFIKIKIKRISFSALRNDGFGGLLKGITQKKNVQVT